MLGFLSTCHRFSAYSLVKLENSPQVDKHIVPSRFPPGRCPSWSIPSFCSMWTSCPSCQFYCCCSETSLHWCTMSPPPLLLWESFLLNAFVLVETFFYSFLRVGEWEALFLFVCFCMSENLFVFFSHCFDTLALVKF